MKNYAKIAKLDTEDEAKVYLKAVVPKVQQKARNLVSFYKTVI